MIEENQLMDIKESLKKACENLLEIQEDIEENHLTSASFWVGSLYNGVYNLRKRMNFIDEGER